MTGPASPAVEIRQLNLTLAGMQVLTDVDAAILPGDIVGIIGPNGAGKTSLLNCISGVYPPSSGTLVLNGRVTTRLAPHKIAALGVARTFQSVEAFRDMSVLEFTLLGRHVHGRRGPVQYALGLPYLLGDERRSIAAANESLDYVGLQRVDRRARLRDLPYGAVKLADLARALAMEPSILLLDEPMAGLSPAERDRVSELLVDLTARSDNVTQIIIEHNLSIVKALCHNAIVLVGGSVLAAGKPEDTLARDDVAAAFLGLGAGDSGRRSGTVT
jgi:branched-chain amino acid transport system ATP-binding protein